MTHIFRYAVCPGHPRGDGRKVHCLGVVALGNTGQIMDNIASNRSAEEIARAHYRGFCETFGWTDLEDGRDPDPKKRSLMTIVKMDDDVEFKKLMGEGL